MRRPHVISALQKFDEMRELSQDKGLGEQEALLDRIPGDKQVLSKVGNLVLLRRSYLDTQRNHKLESRWEGPYKVSKVATHGKSVWLVPLQSEKVNGKYHIKDTTKPFVERKAHDSDLRGWQLCRRLMKISRSG